jgi:uroporphyrinogen-III synthase
MKVLVTRPHEDAAPFAAELAARGLTPVVEPLIAVRFDPAAALDLDGGGAQAVLFTSANGVRAFAARTPRRDLPAFAVGDASAQVARAAGFAAVESAGGDVIDLARLVRERLSPEAGALVHAAGSEIAGDLAGLLTDAGFAVRRAVLYTAAPVAALTGETAALLRSGEIGIASFFSPRTASTFVKVAAADFPADRDRAPVAICLSPAVAAALAPLGWRERLIAAAPTRRDLLAALDGFLARPSTAAGTSRG